MQAVSRPSRYRLVRPTYILSLFLHLFPHAALTGAQQIRSTDTPQTDVNVAGYIGNEACAKCHAAIYASYMQTAMDHASGPADENLITGEFTHKPSGVHYSVSRQNGTTWLSFERPGDPMVHGRRELLYYIGQGRRGRTYLFSVEGFVFESPINWYSDRQMWDMAPAYGNDKHMPLNLPATTSCLHCHVSGMRTPLNSSENLYPSPPFFYSGITCERCHGPGAAHVQGGAIVNPSKLSPAFRDQVCMQCHLEGNAAIERPGMHIYDYKPGDDLSRYVRYFVLAGDLPAGLRATSQFESLTQSTCKKRSGDAMTCTTCHNPHRLVAPQDKVEYYRAKCVGCHGQAFAAKHHPKQHDCMSCHMPRTPSSDVAHTEVTDHRILRRPSMKPDLNLPSGDLPTLVSFPPSEAKAQDIRDLALAWQSLADTGMTAAQSKAVQLLRAAVRESPNDAALLAAIGYIDQQHGTVEEARSSYRKALELDPGLVDAATNLGVLEAQQGHVAEAVKLWQSAFARAPGRSEIGMNLVQAFCAAGQYDAARVSLDRVLLFNPDLPAAKKVSANLKASPSRCGL